MKAAREWVVETSFVILERRLTVGEGCLVFS